MITGANPGVNDMSTHGAASGGQKRLRQSLDLLGLERAARERKGLVCVWGGQPLFRRAFHHMSNF